MVPAELGGKTVLRVLHDEGGFTHAAARGLIAAGSVERNGRPVEREDERMKPGDRIQLSFDPRRRYRKPPAPRPAEGYRVVYEDRDVVVAEKAPGLLTVPVPSTRGESLEERLTESYRARGHREPVVLPVHRIDRYTSGLVAFARSPVAWRALRAQFAQGLPERVYLAVAEGRLPREEGTLVHNLAEHPKSLKVRAGREGRRASCRYRVLERLAGATLFEVRLETGRRNQIRVQLAAEGHPIVGDHAYGRPSPWIDRTALHAARLAFDHPTRGDRLAFDSPPPSDFSELLARLRKGRS